MSVRVTIAVMVCVWVVAGTPPASPLARAQTGLSGSVYEGLSEATLEELVASAKPDDDVTLTIANRNIVVFRASVLERSSSERAVAARRLLLDWSSAGLPLQVSSRQLAGASVVTVGDRQVFAILPLDVDQLSGQTVASETARATATLQQALDEIVEARHPVVIANAAFRVLIATIALALLLWTLGRMHQRVASATQRSMARQLEKSTVGAELVRQSRLLPNVKRAVTAVSVLVALMLVYAWLTFSLEKFPYTRPWGESLNDFLLERTTWLTNGIVRAIPSAFSIALILLAMRLVIRGVKLLFDAVEQHRITLPWVYPETAATTRKLVTALLWVFAVVLCYPFVPGSDTDAFKGVSVLVGLMVSLGSSGLVNQVMSGFTATYSRALRVGDFVRVGDIEGTVTHMGTLSTKLETPRHEEVTIPNAVLISQTVVNFSNSKHGVMVPTSITIGYDAPWRQVEALLLLAASRTDGVRQQPAPMVLQTALEDFYVRYTLMVCIESPAQRPHVVDRLHANIQDAFNEHGVQIMSPNYEADPNAPKVVPKDRWFAAPAGDKRLG